MSQANRLQERLSSLLYLVQLLERAVTEMQHGDLKLVAEIEEEWLSVWTDHNQSLYAGGRSQQEIWDALSDLTTQGIDVRPQWREFREALGKLWRLLPTYYQLTHSAALYGASDQDEYVKNTQPPVDYDPAKPFPQYPIPQDIDESA